MSALQPGLPIEEVQGSGAVVAVICSRRYTALALKPASCYCKIPITLKILNERYRLVTTVISVSLRVPGSTALLAVGTP